MRPAVLSNRAVAHTLSPTNGSLCGGVELMTTDTPFGSQLACCGTWLQCLMRLPASSVLAFSEPDSWVQEDPIWYWAVTHE